MAEAAQVVGCSIACSLLPIVAARVVSGSTITVDSLQTTVAWDLHCTLIEAIDNANADSAVHPDCAAGSGADTIELAVPGVYTLNHSDNSDYGPTGLPVIEGEVIINGNGSAIRRRASAEPFRLLAVAPGASLTIHDLALQNGRLDAPLRGAGILNLMGKLVADNCHISANVAEYRCGGIANLSGTTTLLDSTVTNNSAGKEGGGVCNLVTLGDAILVVLRSSLEGNVSGGDGGGLVTAGAERFGAWAYLAQATVADNRAGGAGGGVFQRVAGVPTELSSSLTMIDTTVRKNSAEGSGGGGIAAQGWGRRPGASRVEVRESRILGNEGGFGAGVGTWDGVELAITASTVADNRAPTGSGGGLLVGAGSRLTLQRSTVSGNWAGSALSWGSGRDGEPLGIGAGLVVVDGEATVSLSTFSGNVAAAGDGGAIWVGSNQDWGGEGASVDISSSTIVGNRAGRSGGGLAVAQTPAGTTVSVSIWGSIVADNSDQSGLRGCASVDAASIVSIGDNLGDEDSCGLRAAGDLIVKDVMLSPLGDNGGPTLTHVPEDGSPAIDSVSTRRHAACVDQRGYQRVVDGDDNGEACCDRGSVEARSTPRTAHRGHGDVTGGTIGTAGR